ncbi:Cysteine synthase [Candidatus Rhodobacter oscarellae]|uniref:Cysteine synthase B n=2 Tax=Candidatus Rhodobacter oscarellae TaxID=1675527 RepID=A0A0J9E2J4_9RHOB|nr:Cysteine synthase [Candidatus Rhodobacter lobularis]
MPGPKNSILETIGNTPVVRVNNIGPKHVELYVKLEAFNPLGSVKDRFALAAIEAAEASGELKPGQTVVEATSGNTGIGLAMVCAQKGYPLVITMAENFSVERRQLMRFLGARVVLTPASEKGSGMVAKAEELAAKHGWYLARQFENEANADMHSRTTAVEILNDFGAGGLDYWVTGFGTGGTLKGVGRVLRERSPDTQIVLTEPDNVPILSSGVLQDRDDAGRPAKSHPMFRPHLMQGWSPDFIPKLAEDAQSQELIDAFQPVGGADALQAARQLAANEGIFCGISSGATFAAALKVAEQAPAGSKILAMLPDTGERYMTTTLFEDVETTMSAEEVDISRSTQGYRFDVSGGGAAAAPAKVETKPEIVDLVEKTILEKPVLMYALEWCEFCWSVRKMFDAAGIAYETVDLDSVAYQKDGLGTDIRAVLLDKTGAPTIPQIFVGGEHIGGATETFDAFNDGSLKTRLAKADVKFDPNMTRDAYGFLPTWLHPR